MKFQDTVIISGLMENLTPETGPKTKWMARVF
jgi:hypothetical protein